MKIGIKKEETGFYGIYKNLQENIDYSKEPYNYKVVEVEESYKDCTMADFDSNLDFSAEKYSARKQMEKDNLRIAEIKPRLEQLSQDIVQSLAGAEFEDLAERQKEFQTLHNELRVLLGKEPRKYLEVTNETNN